MEIFGIIFLGVAPTAMLFLLSMAIGTRSQLHPFKIMAWTLLLGYTAKSFYLAYAVATGAPFATDFLSKDIVWLGQSAVCLGTFSYIIGVLLFTKSDAWVAAHPIAYSGLKRPAKYPEPLYYAV